MDNNNNKEEAKGGGRAKRSEDSSASGEEAGGAAAAAAAASNSGRPSSASTLEEEERIRRRREQNTIHSRRKRERQKIEVEVLREQCAGLSARNLNLFHENKRLQRLLELGQQAVEQHDRQYGPNDPQGQTGGTALADGSAQQPNQQHFMSQQPHGQLHLDPVALQTMQLLMQQQQRQQPPASTDQLGSFFPGVQQHQQPQPHHLPPLANQLASTLPGLLQQQLAGILSFQRPDTDARNLQGSILDPAQEWRSPALGAAPPLAPQDLQATMREQLQQQQQASSAPSQSQQLLLLRQLVQLGVAPERIIAIMGQPPSETRQGEEPSRTTATPLAQQVVSRLTGQQQHQAGAPEQNSQEEEPEGEPDRKPPAKR